MIHTASQLFLITVANLTMISIDNNHACDTTDNILVPLSSRLKAEYLREANSKKNIHLETY